MTDDKSPGMEMFKGKVRGFPTYMVVMKSGGNVTGMTELQVKSRSAQDVMAAAKAL